MVAIDTIEQLARRRRRIVQLRDDLRTRISGGDTQIDLPYQRWRRAVQEYIEEIRATPFNERAAQDQIANYSARLDEGFDMEIPSDHIERFWFLQHFEQLLTELEALTDLVQGEEYTRAWLLREDSHLGARLSTGPETPMPEIQEQEAAIPATDQ